MNLNTLSTDELIQIVHLHDEPTKLEVALLNKLISNQKMLQNLIEDIEAEL